MENKNKTLKGTIFEEFLRKSTEGDGLKVIILSDTLRYALSLIDEYDYDNEETRKEFIELILGTILEDWDFGRFKLENGKIVPTHVDVRQSEVWQGDHALMDALKNEIPFIVNWALIKDTEGHVHSAWGILSHLHIEYVNSVVNSFLEEGSDDSDSFLWDITGLYADYIKLKLIFDENIQYVFITYRHRLLSNSVFIGSMFHHFHKNVDTYQPDHKNSGRLIKEQIADLTAVIASVLV